MKYFFQKISNLIFISKPRYFRISASIILLLNVYFIFIFLFSENNLISYINNNKRYRELKLLNSQIDQEIKRTEYMIKELRDKKSSITDYVDELARDNLDYSLPEEQVFIYPNK